MHPGADHRWAGGLAPNFALTTTTDDAELATLLAAGGRLLDLTY